MSARYLVKGKESGQLDYQDRMCCTFPVVSLKLRDNKVSAATIASLVLPLVRKEWEIVRKRIDLEHAHLVRHPELKPPLVAQQLLISGEDHRHARHPGFDVIGICRAVWRRVSEGKREGASTIEQQIVRTVLENRERTIRRKIREIMLATIVSSTYTKDFLPMIYLSIGYYGWRMNGYRQACRRLNLRSGFLTLFEAASLVARLKYPEPRATPVSRRLQIYVRTRHLIRLYRRHSTDGTYGYLR